MKNPSALCFDAAGPSPTREPQNRSPRTWLSALRGRIDFGVKHVSFRGMKTMSIRDLRQRWPEAEKALQTQEEIIITRDSKPVAKLVRVVEKKPTRKRWDAEKHKRWQKKMWGDTQVSLVDKYLQADREDRKL
jgi:antitoxin (DNA-binding transcriptional repressor) of toxin-antitoxin stability system